MLLSMLTALLTAQPQSNCESMLGRPISALDFQTAIKELPQVQPRGDYETTASFEARMETAARQTGSHAMLVARDHNKEGLSFDPDSGRLKIYPSVFGHGRLNFGQILGIGMGRGKSDSFSSALGFELSSKIVETTTYQTTNGFGAVVNVQKRVELTEALFEAPGRRGQSPFFDTKAFVPLADLEVDAATARSIIEDGSVAFQVQPRGPFVSEGILPGRPTFRHPIEIERHVTVLHGDIQCAFLLDGSNHVVLARSVR